LILCNKLTNHLLFHDTQVFSPSPPTQSSLICVVLMACSKLELTNYRSLKARRILILIYIPQKARRALLEARGVTRSHPLSSSKLSFVTWQQCGCPHQGVSPPSSSYTINTHPHAILQQSGLFIAIT